MSVPVLSEDQRDALQEITNIGMGQAGASVAEILGEFVHLSVPRVLVLAPALIPPALERIVGTLPVSAVRQGFHGGFRGEAVLIVADTDWTDLDSLMGYSNLADVVSQQELLLDLTNVLVGACLGGLAEQIALELNFSAPSMLAQHVEVASLIRAGEVDTPSALFIEVNFKLERRAFACHLVMLMTEHEIVRIRDAVDRFLAAL